jgi:hypothetical protein
VRWRTLSTGLAIAGGLALYAVVVVSIAQVLPDHWAVDLAFYAVAGIAWVLPAARMIAWARRDDP